MIRPASLRLLDGGQAMLPGGRLQCCAGWLNSSPGTQEPVPGRFRPLCGQAGGGTMQPSVHRCWSWLPLRWRWWIFIFVVVAVLFPRIVELLLSLVIRLITRAFLSLAMHVFKEVWSQAMMAVAVFEEGVAQWLYLQLGMIVAVEPAPPPLLANGPTASPQPSTTGSGHSHPTRPIDVPIDGAHARPWFPTTPADWGVGETPSDSP